MIEVYKLLTGKEQIDYKQFFRLAENHYGVRGHEKQLSKVRSRLDTRKFFCISHECRVRQQFQERIRPLES